MKHLKLTAAILASVCAMNAFAVSQLHDYEQEPAHLDFAVRNQTLYIMHDTQGSHLRAGDVLVADGNGGAALYRGNAFVRMVQDPENLVSSHDSSKPIYITNAEGAVVHNLSTYEGDVFLSADAPQIVYYKKEFNDSKPHSVSGNAGSSVDMTLHGGNILQAATAYSIFWGSYGTDIQSGMTAFFNGFSGSSIANASKEYNGVNNVFVSGNTSYGGAYTDSSSPPRKALSTSSAVTEACNMSGNNPDPNGVYFIFTSTGAGHVSYCAWHSWGTCSNGKPVQVAYMPNIAGQAGCDPGAPYGTINGTAESQGLAALANVTSHEFSEAITDPRGTGWFDSSNGENGDKCAWSFHNNVNFSNNSTWKLQMEWSNYAFDHNTGYANRSGQNGCLQ
jgi:hypothetical protein